MSTLFDDLSFPEPGQRPSAAAARATAVDERGVPTWAQAAAQGRGPDEGSGPPTDPESLLQGLNPQQREAVLHEGSPLMLTWKGTGLRSRSANCSGVQSLVYSGRSSITANWIPCPICGAASPTPGAAYMVSFICWINSRISRLRISLARSGRAARRSTGSPACTMVRGIFL